MRCIAVGSWWRGARNFAQNLWRAKVDNCLGDFASSLNDLRSASAVDEEIFLQ
ncbi:hypothetical protein Tsp_01519 [Trichinella spiralis]|uniref:hypothetical protein n=1 Tax=Trichinella spiralis TaxID=6334 RepID=UPI0001EFBCAF|nr:hypothetical protein Tsp_01519 [Trichinella spiralis]